MTMIIVLITKITIKPFRSLKYQSVWLLGWLRNIPVLLRQVDLLPVTVKYGKITTQNFNTIRKENQ